MRVGIAVLATIFMIYAVADLYLTTASYKTTCEPQPSWEARKRLEECHKELVCNWTRF